VRVKNAKHVNVGRMESKRKKTNVEDPQIMMTISGIGMTTLLSLKDMITAIVNMTRVEAFFLA
jgi:hypothetical protein